MGRRIFGAGYNMRPRVNAFLRSAPRDDLGNNGSICFHFASLSQYTCLAVKPHPSERFESQFLFNGNDPSSTRHRTIETALVREKHGSSHRRCSASAPLKRTGVDGGSSKGSPLQFRNRTCCV